MTLEEGEYKTLSLLELTGPAPVTATQGRRVQTLNTLIASGFVETYVPSGQGVVSHMRITDKGRDALSWHRKGMQ
jgi:hypothetical protein